jgi:hypothetical protein
MTIAALCALQFALSMMPHPDPAAKDSQVSSARDSQVSEK